MTCSARATPSAARPATMRSTCAGCTFPMAASASPTPARTSHSCATFTGTDACRVVLRPACEPSDRTPCPLLQTGLHTQPGTDGRPITEPYGASDEEVHPLHDRR